MFVQDVERLRRGGVEMFEGVAAYLGYSVLAMTISCQRGVRTYESET